MNVECHKKMRQSWRQVYKDNVKQNDNKNIVEYNYSEWDMALSNWKLM